MAFSIPAEFTDGKVIVGMNMALSDKDKAIIAALYPG
jgi:hypothetical protein